MPGVRNGRHRFQGVRKGDVLRVRSLDCQLLCHIRNEGAKQSGLSLYHRARPGVTGKAQAVASHHCVPDIVFVGALCGILH